MLPHDVIRLWKKLYILTGQSFTINHVNDIINRNRNGWHLNYPASRMMELGYIQQTQFMSYHEYEFTEKFIDEVNDVTR